ncbi:tetratricopeptide repeat-containing sensor histidine kinase [Taibaiella koreensis]|uniref:tetratricopeptide repeat-containing sensor histidine kinase n=1 Tax=Taibaiella koreensis TaxID=1268548 RepID=UPI000E59DBF7|nr:ATP-binding protein [Taibaiella koreensis]
MGKLRLLLLLLPALLPFVANGQEFFSRLGNPPETPLDYMDSIAIYRILDRGYKLQNSDKTPDSAMVYYKAAMREAQLRRQPQHRARILTYMATWYIKKADYPSAIRFMSLSAEAYLQKGEYPFKQYFSLSGMYAQIGAYDQAIDLYHKVAARTPRSTVDSYYYYLTFTNAAGAYWENGQADSATKLYYRILSDVRRADTNHAVFIRAYTGLANIQMRLEQWDKVWPLVDKAIALAKHRGDSSEIINTIANKGTIFYQKKQYKEAKAYHYQALAYAYRKNDSHLIYASAFILGAILAKEGRFPEAQRMAREAYNKAAGVNSTTEWLSSSYLMGCVYTHTGQYAIAKRYLLPAIAYAERYNNLINAGDGYDHLSTIYAGLGLYKKALYYKERQLKIQDSFTGSNNAGRIAEVEMKFKTAEKDKLIAQKELQLATERNRLREKNIWIGGLASGGLLLAFILAALYSRKQHREKLHRVLILNMEKDTEILALKAKMEGEEGERSRLARDLHDGVVVKFSAVKMNLSILPERHLSLRDSGDFHQIISRLDEATTELRTTAHNLLPDTLLEGGLSEAVYYFCKNVQHSGLDIDLQYTDIPRFEPGFELSVYRIVQELVQNVLKHAAATQAMVQMIYNEALLNITVEDNGKGFVPGAGGGEGIGLRNLRSRTASLNGYMDLRSNPGQGTSVYLEFTIHKITQ